MRIVPIKGKQWCSHNFHSNVIHFCIFSISFWVIYCLELSMISSKKSFAPTNKNLVNWFDFVKSPMKLYSTTWILAGVSKAQYQKWVYKAKVNWWWWETRVHFPFHRTNLYSWKLIYESETNDSELSNQPNSQHLPIK